MMCLVQWCKSWVCSMLGFRYMGGKNGSETMDYRLVEYDVPHVSCGHSSYLEW